VPGSHIRDSIASDYACNAATSLNWAALHTELDAESRTWGIGAGYSEQMISFPWLSAKYNFCASVFIFCVGRDVVYGEVVRRMGKLAA
jgi:hypothetical protein